MLLCIHMLIDYYIRFPNRRAVRKVYVYVVYVIYVVYIFVYMFMTQSWKDS